jgi:hypothetical protein
VDRYDRATDFGFDTYADGWIRRSIEETIRDGPDAASNALHPAVLGWGQARPERSYFERGSLTASSLQVR